MGRGKDEWGARGISGRGDWDRAGCAGGVKYGRLQSDKGRTGVYSSGLGSVWRGGKTAIRDDCRAVEGPMRTKLARQGEWVGELW